MISRLQIRNFQRHEQLRIKLDPQITTIVGPSDSGKSSIIRSLCWVAKNRPRGDGFVRDGESKVSVKLQAEDHTVERKRGPSENLYLLDGNGLAAFGNDVPEQIEGVLNLDNVNFQLQHESPFWFSLTAGEVAKRLNQIVNLELIDEVTSKLGSQLRKAKSVEEVIQDRLKVSKKDLADLCFVPALEGDLSELEKLDVNRVGLIAQEAVLRDLVENLIVYGETIEKLSGSLLEGLRIVSEGQEWERLESREYGLIGLIGLIKERKEEASSKIPNLEPLEDLAGECDYLSGQVERLKELVRVIQYEMMNRDSLCDRLEEAKRKVREEVGDICPICGGMMK